MFSLWLEAVVGIAIFPMDRFRMDRSPCVRFDLALSSSYDSYLWHRHAISYSADYLQNSSGQDLKCCVNGMSMGMFTFCPRYTSCSHDGLCCSCAVELTLRAMKYWMLYGKVWRNDILDVCCDIVRDYLDDHCHHWRVDEVDILPPEDGSDEFLGQGPRPSEMGVCYELCKQSIIKSICGCASETMSHFK